MSPGGGDIPCAQRMKADVVVQVVLHEPVAGSFGTGDGLGEQLSGASRVNEVARQQARHEAPAQHDIIAELPGALDRLLAEGKSSLRLADEVVNDAECLEGFDEQPVVAMLTGELHTLFPEPPCCRQVALLRGDRGSDQRRCVQLGICAGTGPLQHGHEQREGFLVPGTRLPVAPEGAAHAVKHPRSDRHAGFGDPSLG